MKRLSLITILLIAFTSCKPNQDAGNNAGVPSVGGYGSTLTAFDASAVGKWVTRNCYNQQNQTSLREVVIFKGAGLGSSYHKVFQGFGCRGKDQVTNQGDFAYSVTSYANSIGRLLVNTQNSDVSFFENQMTWVSDSDSIIYVKTN